jgi:hypothetical protein
MHRLDFDAHWEMVLGMCRIATFNNEKRARSHHFLLQWNPANGILLNSTSTFLYSATKMTTTTTISSTLSVGPGVLILAIGGIATLIITLSLTQTHFAR